MYNMPDDNECLKHMHTYTWKLNQCGSMVWGSVLPKLVKKSSLQGAIWVGVWRKHASDWAGYHGRE